MAEDVEEGGVAGGVCFLRGIEGVADGGLFQPGREGIIVGVVSAVVVDIVYGEAVRRGNRAMISWEGRGTRLGVRGYQGLYLSM